MALLPGDYKHRVSSTTKNSAVTSGFANSPVHVSSTTGFRVAVQASVITLLSINVTSTAGVNMWFQDSAGTKQPIMSGALTARDYKMGFYCPWDVYISTDADVTVYVCPPSKGATIF